MVEVIGVEPMTFRVQGGRSANWATPPNNMIRASFSGGPKSTRTTDLPVISGVL